MAQRHVGLEEGRGSFVILGAGFDDIAARVAGEIYEITASFRPLADKRCTWAFQTVTLSR
jgi:hypothetical protein